MEQWQQEVFRVIDDPQRMLNPRGQGSCLSGGPLPVDSGIVLDLTKMNQKL